jgi:hypothetical protein
MQYEVTKEDSFDCAIRLIKLGYTPLVLSFSSGTNPGGGWRGKQVGTQEESLCRRSNLGLELEKKKYPISDMGYHYIKNVVINKDPNMNQIESMKCSVIACELKSISERSTKYLEQKISMMYECATHNNHNAIVLGAIGCGAFKESNTDAEILAKVMKTIAQKYPNIKTVYAIYKGKLNYEVFKKEMSK